MTYKTERTITIGDITISVRTSDRTTLNLDVSATGEVIVRGPRYTTDAQAIDLAQRRRRWIYRQLARIAATTPKNPIKFLDTGEVFTVLGRPHRLRIVPDAEQTEPITHHLHPETGDWLHIRHTTATKLHIARRTLINFYAKTAKDWLKITSQQIATFAPKPDIPLVVSTHLRTTRAHYHPTRGITLHWATIQLAEPSLHELIHRTLNLHTIADTHQLDHDLQNLWLGRLSHRTAQPAPNDNCPDCSAPPGTLHADRCDIARCAFTGRQRAHCHPGNTCNTVWTGQIPGQAECTEYGFYCRPGPGGYEPCNADDPDAMQDFNRLYRECRWDPAAQRMILQPYT
ncbi:YgjP-like metallopeptidase domain-containing protein [Streptomyces sp. NPDC048506]|uniref:YgjP-like metallopeptidase domain-containing protein n=1 Tax=Streptomyces sp. NPDC048506 TaxID=3155028 RepID=UPI00341F6A3A